MVANRELAKKKGISEEVCKEIDTLHDACDRIIEMMASCTDLEDQRFWELLGNWRNNQTKLQRLWKWPVRKELWMEHRLPHCSCPKLDNDDMRCHMYISGTCPIHGKKR